MPPPKANGHGHVSTHTKIGLAVSRSGFRAYQVAAMAGIHPPTFSYYCSGRRLDIPPHHLRALSKVLGLPPAELVGWVDIEKPPRLGEG